MRIDILIFGENIQYLTLKCNLIYRLLKYIELKKYFSVSKFLLCIEFHKYVLNFVNTFPASTG